MPKNKALCILTGASRGIGNAILEKLCDNGYNVIAISRSNLAAQSLGKPQRNEQIFHVPFDLGKVEKFQDLETVSSVSQLTSQKKTFCRCRDIPSATDLTCQLR